MQKMLSRRLPRVITARKEKDMARIEKIED